MKVTPFMKHEVARLVGNWARWHYSKADGGGYGQCNHRSVTMGVAPETFEGPSVPVLTGEAEDVDAVMAELSTERFRTLRRVLELQFVWQPPVHQRFRNLGVTQSTYYRLVTAAVLEFWGRVKRRREKGLDTRVGKKYSAIR